MYCDLLINACVRYDKTKKANIGKRRNVYNSNIDTIHGDYATDVFDYVPPNWGIDLPLMRSTISMLFPLGIHLLPGLATLPDLHSGLILYNQDPKGPSESMMVLFTCQPKFLYC